VNNQEQIPSDEETLPLLFGRLGDQLSRLVDLRLSLLKVELKEDVDAYVRGGITMAIGGLIAAIGFGLANIALAFFVSTLFANTALSQPAKYALGFVITGLVYLITGGVIVMATKRRLAQQGIVPARSAAEFEHDKQLVKKIIHG
jgi:hypothetical protein